MAIGRQDYQAGVVPIKSGYSLSQTKYFDHEAKTLSQGQTKSFCEYTVGAGYRLNVCGYRVFASFPGLHNVFVYIDAAIIMYFRLDMEVIDNFPEGATLEVEAGELFKVAITNADELEQEYNVMIYGYLEQLVV